ncbi:gliding motility-associated C-terminal domain-containing protein [Croceivirga thetidis]|uniref:Gliding motility-associated C-terminal domain-containing protein n=1 Tax=Croceivirga thetidis TaxID=2721623 RepID=A0ABX1GR20_9FLAO|nr:gliding motility-associated C-terminal domain-containing protein [Croceivirga thetidis]NKI31227.1 gliding motility-associated C-terminal domain-containing protein [Croceivirga thetidis]
MSVFSKYGVLLVSFLVWFSSQFVSAQILNKPEAADNPNLPGNSAWTAACASENFNEYFVNFTWTPPPVNPENEFILELSDANGDFSNPTTLTTVDDQNNVFDFDFSFALPETTRGDGYRFRVRSTSPELTSPVSDPYPMYYIGYRDPILISKDRNGEIPSGGQIQVCNGESLALGTHNVDNPENYEYNWYNNGALLSERSSLIEITDPGLYYVEIDYGASCSGSANTLSNTVEVIFVDALNVSISASTSTNICNGETVDLVASVDDPNLFYTWYQDGQAVTARILGLSTYTVDSSTAGFDGQYYVEVQGNNPCIEQSNNVEITDAGTFDVTNDQELNLVLLPGQTRTLSVSSTATNPTYQWYKDGVALTGETNQSLEVTEAGDYYVTMTQGGACSNSQVDSETYVVVTPDSFELLIEYATSYAPCANADVTLNLLQINALFSAQSPIDVTNDLINDFSYQWTLDGNIIVGETSSSLMIVGNTNNGDYELTATLGSFTPISNTLSVELTDNSSFSISSDGTALCFNQTLTVTSDQTLANEVFEWTQNGVPINNTDESITVSEPGIYQLVVESNSCPSISNTIEITPFDDSGVTIDVEEEFLLVEGTSVIVTAEGAETYEWYDESNNLISSEATASISLAGTYLLIASLDNCSVTRTFTAIYRDEFEVPNVITVNGDGINDLWLLPNIYSGNPNVKVTIFDAAGNQIFQQVNYQNNWPESNTQFTKQNMIFYYNIKESGTTVKQGTITVIK